MANATVVFRPDIFPQTWNIITKFLMVTVSIFGIIANLKVIFIITRNKNLRTPLMLLLMNLSIADLVAGFSIYPFVFVDVSRTKSTALEKDIICAFSPAMVPFFIAAAESVFTLCAISISRFIIIKYPMKLNLKLTKRGSIIFSVTSWLLSLVLLSPNVMSVRYEDHTGFCFRYYPTWMNAEVYRVILLILGTFLPISTMTMTYIVAWRKLKRTYVCDARMRVANINNPRRKIMVMLGALIFTYVCCWTPFYVYWGLVSAAYYKDTVNDKIRLFRFYTIAILFAQCNSALDPIIYTLSGEQFRTAMYRLWRSNRVRPVLMPNHEGNEREHHNIPLQRVASRHNEAKRIEQEGKQDRMLSNNAIS